MKRKIILTCLTVVLLLSACGLSEEVFEQPAAQKILYVGDAPGVAGLLTLSPIFDENFTQNMFSIQTQSEPFGIVVYYEPSDNWAGAGMTITDEMTIFSEYLFERIGNLGYVEFAYRLSNSGGNLEKDEYQTLLRVYRN